MPRKRTSKLPESLHKALERLDCEETLKSKANSFLQANFAAQTRRDFDELFMGLQVTLQLLGPLHIAYCRTLETMRKCLATEYKLFLASEGRWFRGDVQRVWVEVCKMLKAHLSPEIWKAVGAQMEALFSGKPPKI